MELTQLQRQLGTTAIYVTHDQVEAMTMADRIVVLNAGRIEQYGAPIELYERPANVFVAGFIGSPRMNLVTGEAARALGAETIGIRPEHISLGGTSAVWGGRVTAAEHLGSDTFAYVEVPGIGSITARCPGEVRISAGDSVDLTPDPARIHRFGADGRALR